jgi:HAD superfamily hydrolase (TIGR01484 family)
MNQPRKFLALATDYDGTIAQHGRVSDSTYRALVRWKDAERKLILVTGRELPDLFRICPFITLFDRIVAENGAMLFNPATDSRQVLAPEPPRELIDYLRLKGVQPLSIGRVIVATQEVFRPVVLQAIEELGLKWKVVLNKGALMVLPHDVDKTTGLTIALGEMNISAADTVGIGDAENDQMFLSLCGFSVAVANALGFLKKQVHFVTRSSHGAGAEELIEKLLTQAAHGMPPKEVQEEFPAETFGNPTGKSDG